MSRRSYGADVSGIVFKEIADRIYGTLKGHKTFIASAKPDSSEYDYFGIKNDMASIFTTLNIPYSDISNSGNWRSVQLKNNTGILNTPHLSVSSSGSVTPDVIGMGLKDAVYLLENMGLQVTATGRGRVANQSMVAGTAFIKNQKISLILN